VQGQKVLGVGKSIEATKTKATTKPKATTRKSPSQTCVSPAETEANSRNKTKPPKRGQSPNKNTHRIDLPLDAVAYPLHHYQKHAT